LLMILGGFSNSYNIVIRYWPKECPTLTNGETTPPGLHLAPSTAIILRVLEEKEDGWVTLKQIVQESRLPRRTVKYAVKQLKDGHVLEERPNWDDLRSKLLRLRSSRHDVGKTF
jgi:hypothetical protein